MPKTSKRDDNPVLTQADVKRAIRFRDLPASLQSKALRRVRGPQKTPTKVGVHIRLSPDVLEALRGSGNGWQGRVDDALRAWLNLHAFRAGSAGITESKTTAKH
jgi:uncharacterized protein (DUF4415 family)